MTSITPGQQKQYKRFVEDAADKALAEVQLDKDGLQKLIENGDEFQDRIITAIRELSANNLFIDEQVYSTYVYPKGYKVKRISDQVAILRKFFPNIIGFADEKLAEQPLPPNAEGWFAIPKWEKLGPTYGEAVDKVLMTIKSKRTLYNHYQTGSKYLRQHAKTMKAFQKLGGQQKGYDIFVVPCQFGLRHKGRSVRRAREVMNANEFGLGVFAIGIMLLTHPQREIKKEQLHLDCAGDEFSLDADGVFSRVPLFDFNDGRVEFRSRWFGHPLDYYGSASGFLSEVS